MSNFKNDNILPSNFQIGDLVEFKQPMIEEWASGQIVAVRFTKAKVFYAIVDDFYGSVFDDIDSIDVRVDEFSVGLS